MSQRTREKQALGVFVLLIVLSTIGLAWYMVAGHSWNVAASNIDERVGQMDGYTAVVFAGTLPSEVEEPTTTSNSASSSDQGTSSSGANSSVPGASGEGASDAARSNDGKAVGAGASAASSATPSGKTSKNGASSAGTGQQLSAAPEMHSEAATGLTSDIDGIAAPVVPDEESARAQSGDSEEASADKKASVDADASSPSTESDVATQADGRSQTSSAAKGSNLVKSAPVDPSQVSTNYEGKGASVLVVDTQNPSTYSDGCIVKRGSKRIGVFSVDVPLSDAAAQERIDYFKDAKVDIIICISSVKSYVRNLSGADIVITLQDDDVSTMGSTSNGMFFVNAPKVDSVGAILVSPSNVVSAKVVETM